MFISHFTESWLKRRWYQLRAAYNSDPALSKHLSFLKKSTKRTDRSSDKMKNDHRIDESDEFNVTQEQLDESMDEPNSSDLNTIHFDADNESTGSCQEYEFTIVSDAEDAESSDAENHKKVKTIKIEKVVENGSGRTTSASRQIKKPTFALNESSGSEVNEMEYQDKVFGDLVSAMLAKMTPEKKKQAKKEIMNILL